MTALKVAKVGAKVMVLAPFVVAGVIRDEIKWRRVSGRVPSEPGMREWIAATWEDVARVHGSLRG